MNQMKLPFLSRIIFFLKSKPILREIIWFLFNLLTIPLIIVLKFFDLVFNIRFVYIFNQRIGHLVINNYLFFKKLKWKDYKKRYIGLASIYSCNVFLFKKIKENFYKVIKIYNIIHSNDFFRIIGNEKSWLYKLKLFQFPQLVLNEYKSFIFNKKFLTFNKNEEKKGKLILKKNGVKNWFVCFHARDSLFLKNLKNDISITQHSYRNCNIENFLKAMEYITFQGGYAIRMGHIVEKRLLTSNKNIIDYTGCNRTDFGDVYLSANCKFFLGNTSGLVCIPMVNDIRTAWTNLVPFNHIPMRFDDLFIFKKVWSKKQKKFLTFKEIIQSDIFLYEGIDFKRADLELIENTPEEILDISIEMNERIDGTWKTTGEDEYLQKKFRLLFKQDSFCYGFPSRIGAKFLQKNKYLLK